MVFTEQMEVTEYLFNFFIAPVHYPNVLPELLPLILGVFVLEVYFEKANADRAEKADPIGNALLWLSTGLALLMEFNAEGQEVAVVYFLIFLGGGTLLMEFMERWRQKFRIFHSFVTPIYSIAYLSVILVGTPLTVNFQSIKAALIFMALDVVFFYFWKKIVPVPNK